MNTDLAKVQKLLDWVKRLLYLDIISSSAKKRIVKRGQVYWCDFGCAVGSEMQKNRPAVIIQNDLANLSSGNTIVIPITHDTATISALSFGTAHIRLFHTHTSSVPSLLVLHTNYPTVLNLGRL